MNQSAEARRGARALAALGFDPNSVLAREPGVLLDPSFLGAMHAELEAELGAAEAAKTLMQVGLIQGLHDATRAVGHGFEGHDVLQPPLAIRFQAVRVDDPPGAIEMVGSWPERTEASAHLSLVGACDHTACHLSAGYTSGWLSGTMDANILAIEQHCSAAGEPECSFVAREVDAWRADGDERTLELLADLPFDAIRELVNSQSEEPSFDPTAIANDDRTAIVHIWDTVMVIPFTNTNESLQAVELISEDEAARNVSVIVLDLDGAIIDDAFGAMLLEQIVESAEARGAEVIFAAPSSLSEPVVADLDRPPLMVYKDLAQAVAAAFQVTSAQRTLI